MIQSGHLENVNEFALVSFLVFFQYCEVKSTADNSSGCITAQGRASDDETTGFIFVGGSITGTGYNLLGRAYGLYSRVLFIDTYMDNIINPQGWSDWPTTVTMYNSRSGKKSSVFHSTSPLP